MSGGKVNGNGVDFKAGKITKANLGDLKFVTGDMWRVARGVGVETMFGKLLKTVEDPVLAYLIIRKCSKGGSPRTMLGKAIAEAKKVPADLGAPHREVGSIYADIDGYYRVQTDREGNRYGHPIADKPGRLMR